jgi:hypothetical protein
MRNELFLFSNGVKINFMYFEDGFDIMCNGVESGIFKYIEDNKGIISSVTVYGSISEKLKDFIVSNVNDYDFE